MGRGRPRFPRDFSCRVVLERRYVGSCARTTGLSPAVVCRSRHFAVVSTRCAGMSAPAVSARNPRHATPDSLAHGWFRLIPFRSPLIRDCFRFLGGHEMFQFPHLPPTKVGPGASPPGGCPIRRRWAHGLSAPPPSFRCWTASFIGWSCRGILQPRIMSCLVMDHSAVAGIAHDIFARSVHPERYPVMAASTAP